MKAHRRMISLAALAAGLIAMPAQAATLPSVFSLPTAIEGQTSLTYGTQGTATTTDDFQIFSLPYSYFLATGIATGNPTGAFGVDSAPGQIADYVVVLSQANGTLDNSDTLGGLGDNAFGHNSNLDRERFGAAPVPAGEAGNTPNAANLAEPSPTFAGDSDGLWDVRLSALRDYLSLPDGSIYDPVFFFNMNETGTGENQDMRVWAQVSFLDEQSGQTLNFTLDGSTVLAQFASQTEGGPYDFDDLGEGGDGPAGTNSSTAMVHGVICVGHDAANTPASRTLVALGQCGDVDPALIPPGTVLEEIDQNLGQNIAAFAIFNQALANAVWGGIFDVMRIDLRIGEMDNGPDQLFIGGALRPTDVPEPAALGLLGMGLAALGLARRRRRKA